MNTRRPNVPNTLDEKIENRSTKTFVFFQILLEKVPFQLHGDTFYAIPPKCTRY